MHVPGAHARFLSCPRWRAQHRRESRAEPSSAVAQPSCSARIRQTCVFPVHLCVSALQTTHNILPPSLLLKTRLKPTGGEWHAASLMEEGPHPGSVALPPLFIFCQASPVFPPEPLDLAIWTSRLRKKAHCFERWTVSFCLWKVSSCNSSVQIPPNTHPTQDLPRQILGEAKSRRFWLANSCAVG